MTTAIELIQAGFREGNLIAAGKQPTEDEQTEALGVLNRFVNSIFGYEMGENLTDWNVPPQQRTATTITSYPQDPSCSPLSNQQAWQYQRPPKNQRIVFGGIEVTVYFPSDPMDGSRMALVQGSGEGVDYTPGSILTLDGNGRTIEGTATLDLETPVQGRQWLYRADLADWVRCQDMELDDESPFPKEFDDFFICALSMRLAPRYGKVTATETQQTAIATLKRLKTRYRQANTTIYGSGQIPGSGQSFNGLGGVWW